MAMLKQAIQEAGGNPSALSGGSSTPPTGATGGAGTGILSKANGLSPTGDMDHNRPTNQAEAMRLAQLASRPGQAALAGPDQEATPEEQGEYERAREIIAKSLYQGKTAQAISEMLRPEEKVGSVAKASVYLITTLDNQFDFDETTIPQITQDTTSQVIELYETQYRDPFSEQESNAALGSAWEMVIQNYGVDADSYAELTNGMGKNEYRQYEDQYNGLLRAAQDG